MRPEPVEARGRQRFGHNDGEARGQDRDGSRFGDSKCDHRSDGRTGQRHDIAKNADPFVTTVDHRTDHPTNKTSYEFPAKPEEDQQELKSEWLAAASANDFADVLAEQE
jgi:hypothetical protein